MDDQERADPGRGGRSACEFDADALRLRLDTTIPGTPSAIPPVVERIMKVVEELGCAHDQEYEIRLALSEALANAVLHGCHGDPDQCVQIGVECDPERGMLIVVRDPGAGFDPSQIPSPVVGEQLFRDRGRGIFLINQLMREVSFNRRGTEIRMRPRTGGGAGGGEG